MFKKISAALLSAAVIAAGIPAGIPVGRAESVPAADLFDLQIAESGTLQDGGTYQLAAPQHTAHYLTHPRQARRDFAEARWKIGFLQRAVPLPLPYGKLYLKLKK